MEPLRIVTELTKTETKWKSRRSLSHKSTVKWPILGNKNKHKSDKTYKVKFVLN